MKSNKVIISACLCGAGTRREQAPTVPYTPEEIARQVVDVARAGAAVAHIHVRKDTTLPDGTFVEAYKSMDLGQFTQTVTLAKQYLAEAGLDILINLTTSGGEYEDYKRLQHLSALQPDLCSFDPGTRWSTSTPSRRPGPGPNRATASARSSTPSSISTTTPSTRRSSPHTFSTSSASCLPST